MQNDDWFGGAAAIATRLQRPLTRGEVFALLLSAAIAFLFIWVRMDNGGAYYDLNLYLNASQGNFYGYYYAYWVLPFFRALAFLPIPLSHALWASLNIASIWFASRVFGGRSAFALLSFQALYSLIFGQITGVLVGALALLLWGIAQERFWLAGAALTIALTKVQLGFVPGIAILCLSAIPWRARAQILAVPILALLSSFAVYGFWIADVAQRIGSIPPIELASISLWRWLGWATLALWLPPLLLPMERRTRLMALVATNAMALPYYQQADLILLWTMPLGALALLGNLGYVFFIGKYAALQILVLVPLGVDLKLCYAAARGWLSQRAYRPPHGHLGH
jgi:hypothetical protein